MMRWSVHIMCFLILIVTIYSCVNNQNTIVGKDKIENMETLSANLAGYYSGDLPCVDCESIRTMLELHKDKSYVLRYIYEGKSEDQFIKEGEWTIDKNMLRLEGVDYRYKISPDFLVQLDLAGNEIKGDLADKYQLNRIR